MDILPTDVVLTIADIVPLCSFLALSSTSSNLNKICSDETYWKQKTNKEIDMEKSEHQTWKSFYLYNKIYISGELEFNHNITTFIKVPNHDNQKIFQSIYNEHKYGCKHKNEHEHENGDKDKDENEHKNEHEPASIHKKIIIIDSYNDISYLSLDMFEKLDKYIIYRCDFFARLSVRLIVGDSCAAIIDKFNNLSTFGNGVSGELGLDGEKYVKNPTPVIVSGEQLKVREVSFGAGNMMLIDINNNVWGCGYNYDGKLGISKKLSPYGYVEKLTYISGIKAKSISVGRTHALLIDMNDDVWGTGNGGYGQLGTGSYLYTDKFIKIPNIKAKHVACGYSFSVLIDMDNNVLTFGTNSESQLGIENYSHSNIPIKIGVKAKSVSCGINHTVLLDFNGNVLTFGNNEMGQLGLGDFKDRPIPTHIPHIRAQKILAFMRATIIY